MDEFDIIDLVYDHVAAANTELPIYKDNSATGVDENHIVISGLEFHEFEWQNKMPVNVNIFVKLHSNGMPNRNVMRDVKRKIRVELKKIGVENGQYRDIELPGSERLKDAKEGFDCTNIKVIINTQKNTEDYG